MDILIILLFIYATIVAILYARKDKENRINYSNYQCCLRALSETDPKLKEYIEKNSMNKR